jgi:hypothetical protein
MKRKNKKSGFETAVAALAKIPKSEVLKIEAKRVKRRSPKRPK